MDEAASSSIQWTAAAKCIANGGGKARNSREILKRRYRRLRGELFWGFKFFVVEVHPTLDLENCPIGLGGLVLAGADSCFRGLRGRPDGGLKVRPAERCMCFAALRCGGRVAGAGWLARPMFAWVGAREGAAGDGRATLPLRGGRFA